MSRKYDVSLNQRAAFAGGDVDVREDRKRLAQEREDVAHLNTPYGFLGKRMDIDGVDVAYICPHAFL